MILCHRLRWRQKLKCLLLLHCQPTWIEPGRVDPCLVYVWNVQSYDNETVPRRPFQEEKYVFSLWELMAQPQ
eukprot:s15_g38.t1